MDEAQAMTELKLAKANDGYRLHHPTAIPGLFVKVKQTNINGQVTVLQLRPGDVDFHVVWDSAHPPTGVQSQDITIPHWEAATRVPGVTIRNHELESDLKVWYKPTKGPSTFVYVRQFTSEEHAALDNGHIHFPPVQDAETKGYPISSGGDTFQAEDEAEHAVGKKTGETAGQSARKATRKMGGDAGGKTAIDGAKKEIFLFVREAYGGNGKLIINTTDSTVHLTTMKDQETKATTELNFSTDSRIQVYPFPKGRTFRFINCGLRAKVRTGKNNVRKRMCDKKISAVFPPGSGDSEPLEYAGSEAKTYPVYSQEDAVHNEKDMPEFLQELERIVGVGLVEEFDESKVPDVEILTG